MGGKTSAAGPEPGQFANINKKHVTSRFPGLELKTWGCPADGRPAPQPGA